MKLRRSKECVYHLDIDLSDVTLQNLQSSEILSLYILGAISADRFRQLLGLSAGEVEGLLEQFEELLEEYTKS